TALPYFLLHRPPPSSPLFPYTTLFRSRPRRQRPRRRVGPAVGDGEPVPLAGRRRDVAPAPQGRGCARGGRAPGGGRLAAEPPVRSEEHTSELQSRFDLVCRLLLEKKKN